MNFKLIIRYFFLIIVYIIFPLCLNFIYLNIVSTNLSSSIRVLAEGIASLNQSKLSLSFNHIPQEDLFLDLEYTNPGAIKPPFLLVNNNLIEKGRSLKKGLSQFDYFNIPIDFINYGENDLLIEFKEIYPSKITVNLKNFLYKLPSNNLLILSVNKKEVFNFLSLGSILLIPIFVLLTLFVNVIIYKILNVKFKTIFSINGIIILGLTIAFGTVLLVALLTHSLIRITPIYFIKLIIFSLYIMALFTLFQIYNIHRKEGLFYKKTKLFSIYQSILESSLSFYFPLVLLLSFGFILIELSMVSAKIAVMGDIIIVIIFAKLLKRLVCNIRKEVVS